MAKPATNTNQMNKADKAKLFATATKLDATVKEAQEALDAAMAKRSEAVKEIHDTIGTGPFNFGGKICTVSKRIVHEKDADGKKTDKVASEAYFFRQVGQVENIG